MNTTHEEKKATKDLVDKCRTYLCEFILDDKNADVAKAEIIRKLFRIKPPQSDIYLEISHSGKTYVKKFTIRYKRESYPELYVWRSSVFKRDNYTCQRCGEKSGKLEAHHVKKWADNIMQRFQVENGITLCKDCHKKTENYGNKKDVILE